MKIRNSLKSLKSRHRDCRVIRRRGRTYVINKTNRRFKALLGYVSRGGLIFHAANPTLPCVRARSVSGRERPSARVNLSRGTRKP